MPAPLFDTQLAAMVCGYGEEVGYETLVSQIAKGRVDKSSRFTDWARRPLSAQQLTYALGDVIHLRVIYERLRRQLEQTGRSEWVAEELADLTNPKTYDQPLDEAWQRIKVRSREPRFLATLRALAAWREAEAQRRDVPRNRVVRDDLLLEIAANRPTSAEELAGLRRISLDRQSIEGVVGAVRAALALPPDQLPQLEPPPKMPRGLGPAVDLLRVLLKLQCEEHHVAQRLVATSADLEAIASQARPRRRRPQGLALRGVRRRRAGPQARRAEPGHRRRAGRGDAGRRPAQVGLSPRAWVAAGHGAGRLLVVGHHSFIARHFLAACPEPVTAVGHEAIDHPDLLDGVDRIVCFARHPLLGRPATGTRPWIPTCGSPNASPGALSPTSC